MSQTTLPKNEQSGAANGWHVHCLLAAMTKKQLLELFNEPNSKDGFQLAMSKLGLRLSGRNWKLNGNDYQYTGFSFSKNVVSFMRIESREKGSAAWFLIRTTISQAIDCVSGNLNRVMPE